MKIFSGTANKDLAQKIADALHIPLSPLEIYVFPDEEKRVRVIDKIIDEDCVVVQSTSTPADQNYMELFFIVDAIKRSGAKSVTAVVPYLGYQRQDHIFRDGEAVSLEVIIETLEAVGVNRLITLDLHSIKIPELFHIPVTHFSALPVFAQEIKRAKWNDDNTFLVSPDMGGIRRIKKLSEMLSDMPFAAIEKDRDLITGKITKMEISVLPKNKDGKAKKRALIVDDMISSGNTVVPACELLIKKGIGEIFVFATHAVFSLNAPELLEKSLAKKVFVTDTINIPKEKRFEKLKVLSVADMIAKEIR